jgi:prephenate dehydrogenase
VPVKRGEVAGAFAGVRVELADAPGELARVLVAAGEAGVNVEDLRVEHVPGRPRGVVELLVSPGGEGPLGDALRRAGWQVFMSTDRS